jgi:hypothetical protein
MSVKKVTQTSLFFACPGRDGTCGAVNEYAFADIMVSAPDGGMRMLVLPPCPNCGAKSGVSPGSNSDTPAALIRRIAWKRAVAAGNFRAGSEANARAAVGEFNSYYADQQRAAHRALYVDAASTVEVVQRPPQG